MKMDLTDRFIKSLIEILEMKYNITIESYKLKEVNKEK